MKEDVETDGEENDEDVEEEKVDSQGVDQSWDGDNLGGNKSD